MSKLTNSEVVHKDVVDSLMHNFLVSPDKIPKLYAELSQLCDNSLTQPVLENIISHTSKLIRLESVQTKASINPPKQAGTCESSPCSLPEIKTERIYSDRLREHFQTYSQDASMKSIDSRIFWPMLFGKETVSPLLTSYSGWKHYLHETPYVTGCTDSRVASGRRYIEKLSSDQFNAELVTFLEFVSAQVGDLRSLLVAMKLVLSIVEFDSKNAANYRFEKRLIGKLMKSPLLGKSELHKLKSISQNRSILSAQLTAVPSIFALAGLPKKVSSYELHGNAVATVSGLAVKLQRSLDSPGSDYAYFEVTLKGEVAAPGIRIGWSLARNDDSPTETAIMEVENTSSIGDDLSGLIVFPGNSKSSWAIDPFTMFSYNNALEISRIRLRESIPTLLPENTERSSTSEPASEGIILDSVVREVDSTSSCLAPDSQLVNSADSLTILKLGRLRRIGLPVEAIRKIFQRDGVDDKIIDSLLVSEANESMAAVPPSPDTSEQKHPPISPALQKLISSRLSAFEIGGEDLFREVISRNSNVEEHATTKCISAVSGNVIGCLLDRKSGEMSYFVNGKIIANLKPSLLLHDCEICPIFSSITGAYLQVNIGQTEFQYSPFSSHSTAPVEEPLTVSINSTCTCSINSIKVDYFTKEISFAIDVSTRSNLNLGVFAVHSKLILQFPCFSIQNPRLIGEKISSTNFKATMIFSVPSSFPIMVLSQQLYFSYGNGLFPLISFKGCQYSVFKPDLCAVECEVNDSKPISAQNKAGMAMALGQDGVTFYCGRQLGKSAIPHSDGRCGPTNGPQCSDCKGSLVVIPTCSKGHSMVALTSCPAEYPGQPMCDVCRERNLYSRNKYFYHCKPCGFDLCEACSVKVAKSLHKAQSSASKSVPKPTPKHVPPTAAAINHVCSYFLRLNPGCTLEITDIGPIAPSYHGGASVEFVARAVDLSTSWIICSLKISCLHVVEVKSSEENEDNCNEYLTIDKLFAESLAADEITAASPNRDEIKVVKEAAEAEVSIGVMSDGKIYLSVNSLILAVSKVPIVVQNAWTYMAMTVGPSTPGSQGVKEVLIYDKSGIVSMEPTPNSMGNVVSVGAGSLRMISCKIGYPAKQSTDSVASAELRGLIDISDLALWTKVQVPSTNLGRKRFGYTGNEAELAMCLLVDGARIPQQIRDLVPKHGRTCTLTASGSVEFEMVTSAKIDAWAAEIYDAEVLGTPLEMGGPGVELPDSTIPHSVQNAVFKGSIGSIFSCFGALSARLFDSIANLLQLSRICADRDKVLSLFCKSVLDPDKFCFSMIASIILQLRRIGSSDSLLEFDNSYQLRDCLLPYGLVSLLHLLKLNFHLSPRVSTPSATSVCQPSSPTGSATVQDLRSFFRFISPLDYSVSLTAGIFVALLDVADYRANQTVAPGEEPTGPSRQSSKIMQLVAETIVTGINMLCGSSQEKLAIIKALLKRYVVLENIQCDGTHQATEINPVLQPVLNRISVLGNQGVQSLLLTLIKFYSLLANANILVPQELVPVTSHPSNNSQSLIKQSSSNQVVVPFVGMAVQRGPDWCYGNQDGGPGSSGIITQISPWLDQVNAAVKVIWRNGNYNSYRWGVREQLPGVVAEWKLSFDLIPNCTLNSIQPNIDISLSPTAFSGVHLKAGKNPKYSIEELGDNLSQGSNSLQPPSQEYIDDICNCATDEWLRHNHVNISLSYVATLEQSIALYTEFLNQEPVSVSMGNNDSADSSVNLLSSVLNYCTAVVKHSEDSKFFQSFVFGIQSICNGIYSVTSNAQVCAVSLPLADRIMKASAQTNQGTVTWDATENSWCVSNPHPTSSVNGSPDAGTSGPATLLFDPYFASLSLILSRGNTCVVQMANRQWGTIFGNIAIQPRTGIHKWTSVVRQIGSKRCHCIMGVATREFNLDGFLGNDQDSWGLSSGRELLHHAARVKTDYSCKISTSTVIEATLDTDAGTLTFADVSSTKKAEIAFKGLRGLTLYPAWSLYAPGDTVEILSYSPGVEDRKSSSLSKLLPSFQAVSSPQIVKFLGAPHPVFFEYILNLVRSAISMIGENEHLVSNSVISVSLMNGLSCLCRWQHLPWDQFPVLQDLLMQLLSKIRLGICTARQEGAVLKLSQENSSTISLASSDPDSEVVGINSSEITGNSAVESSLRHISVASPTSDSGEVIEPSPPGRVPSIGTPTLSDLACSLNGSSVIPVSTIPTSVPGECEFGNHVLTIGLLQQLALLVSTVLGHVINSYIDAAGANISNHSIAESVNDSEQLTETADDVVEIRTTLEGRRYTSYEYSFLASTPEWLESPLFVNGMLAKEYLVPELPRNIFIDNFIRNTRGTIASAFYEWIDSSSSSIPTRTTLESQLGEVGRAVLIVILHHSGLLALTMHLAKLVVEAPDHSLSVPAFLSTAWRYAVRIVPMIGSIVQKDQSCTTRSVSHKAIGNMRFLLHLCPICQEQLFDRTGVDVKSWIATVNKEKSKLFGASGSNDPTITLILKFATAEISIPYMRSCLRSASSRAISRKDGLKSMRVALDLVSEEFGWACKCALLQLFPKAINGNLGVVSKIIRSNAGVSSSVVTSESAIVNNGVLHYSDGFFGCTPNDRLEVKGAFDSLFGYFIFELSNANSQGYFHLLLQLIMCSNVFLREDDHVLISRLDSFVVLHEILESLSTYDSLSSSMAGFDGISCEASVMSLPRPESSITASATNPFIQIAAKATMKLFTSFALQVASSGSTDSRTVSYSRSAKIGEIKLITSTSRSGPRTLGMKVFDILLLQLNRASSDFRTIIDNLLVTSDNPLELEQKLLTLEIAPDSVSILSEISSLLVYTCKDINCKRLLVSPKWLATLLELCFIGPAECRRRSLHIISDILPDADVASIDQGISVMQPIISRARALLIKDGIDTIISSTSSSLSTQVVHLLLSMASPLLIPHGCHVSNSGVNCKDASQAAASFSQAAFPVQAECVTVLRALLMSSSWSSIIENVFLDAFEQVNVKMKASNSLRLMPDLKETTQKGNTAILTPREFRLCASALAVLGAQFDVPYTNCPAVIRDQMGSEIEFGVISGILESADSAEVQCVSLLEQRALDPSNCAGKSTKIISLNLLRPINRIPFDCLKPSSQLCHSLLKLIGNSTVLCCTDELLAEPFHDHILRILCAKALKSLCSSVNTCDIVCEYLQRISDEPGSTDFVNSCHYGGRGAFAINLLQKSVESTPFGGIEDIPVLEEQLSLLLSLRMMAMFKITVSPVSKVDAEILRTPSKIVDIPVSTSEPADAFASAESDRVGDPNSSGTSVPSMLDVGFSHVNNTLLPSLIDISAQARDQEVVSPSRSDLHQEPSIPASWDSHPNVAWGDDTRHFTYPPSDFERHQDTRGAPSLPQEDHLMAIATLESMGFPREWCEIAYDMCGDLDEALNYILSNPAQLEMQSQMHTREAVSHEREQSLQRSNDIFDQHSDSRPNSRGIFAESSTENADLLSAATEPHLILTRDDLRDVCPPNAAIDEVPDCSVSLPSIVHRNPQDCDGSPSVEIIASKFGADYVSATVENIQDGAIHHVDSTLGFTEKLFFDPNSDINAFYECHYDPFNERLLPIYSEPRTDSERIGAVFPGDDLAVIRERIELNNPHNKWFQIRPADYDGHYSDSSEQPNDIVGWVAAYKNETLVIFEGPSIGSQSNLSSNNESLAVDRTYEVLLPISVREGLEISEEDSCDEYDSVILSSGENLHAVEEVFDSHGMVCLRIDTPCTGWVTKSFGYLRCVSHGPNSSGIRNLRPEAGINGATLPDSGEVTTSGTEVDVWDSLLELDDNLEDNDGNDLFKKEDRFFGSMQGTQYQRSRDKQNVLKKAAQVRRARIMNSPERQANYEKIGNGERSAKPFIVITHGLLYLYFRHAFLALLLRSRAIHSGKRPVFLSTSIVESYDNSGKINVEGASEVNLGYQTPTTRDLSQLLVQFFSLVTLRGIPFYHCGLENLVFDEVTLASLSPNLTTVDLLLRPVVSSFMGPGSDFSDEKDMKTSESLAEAMCSSLVRAILHHVRMASESLNKDENWLDFTYEEDVDGDCQTQPNLHFALWCSHLLLDLHQNLDIFEDLFKVWCLGGLKASSLSLKQISADILSDMLSAMRWNVIREDQKSQPSTLSHSLGGKSWRHVLETSLALLPTDRLEIVGSKRLWYEMEDDPAYSRFMQALLHLLSEARLAKQTLSMLQIDQIKQSNPSSVATIDEHQCSSSASVEFVSNPENSTRMEQSINDNELRPYIAFDSPLSEIQLSPAKDLQGPWTVECWLRRNSLRDSFETENTICDSNTEVVEEKVTSEKLEVSPPIEDKLAANPRITVPCQYLMCSSNGSIKLQFGGRVFPPDTAFDPLQESDPVCDEALCISFVQRGNSEKIVFDCVVPDKRWVHLAIVYKITPVHCVEVFVDGNACDSKNMKFNLPLATIGCAKLKQSFLGDLADIRIWSSARSCSEIKRDMLTNVSQAKGLVAHLSCREGNGIRTLDEMGMLTSCKLSACMWKMGEVPKLQLPAVPSFVLSEPEESDGLFGESIGKSVGVTEMTGVLRRFATKGLQGKFSAEEKEVISIGYRKVETGGESIGNDGEQDGLSLGSTPKIHKIEGYLDWCDRGIRSNIVGSLCEDGSFQFNILPKSTILGAPELADWEDSNFTFMGDIDEQRGSISGSFSYAYWGPRAPKLVPGSCIPDKDTASKALTINKSREDRTTISLKDDAKKCKHLVTFRVKGFPLESNSPAEVVAADTTNSNPAAVRQDDDDEEPFGLGHNEGCLWLEWEVLSCRNSLIIGLCKQSALLFENNEYTTNKDSIYENTGIWSYYQAGNLSNGSEKSERMKYKDGDVLGLQVDTALGTVSFYCNNEFVYSFNGMFDKQPDITLRPFLSLSRGGDSVVFRGVKRGLSVIKFPAKCTHYDDNRSTIIGTIENGAINGLAEMHYHGNSDFSFGHWHQGYRDGVHVWLVKDSAARGDNKVSYLPKVEVYIHGFLVHQLTSEALSSSADPAFSQYQVQLVALRGEVARRYRLKDIQIESTSTDVAVGADSIFASEGASTSSSVISLRSTASSSSRSDAGSSGVLVIVRNEESDESVFEVDACSPMRSLFESYGELKGVPFKKLRFLYNDKSVDSESTAMEIGFTTGSVLQSYIQECVKATDTQATERLFATSTAPFILETLLQSGATVRQGIEIDVNAPVRSLEFGEIIEAYQFAKTKEGIGRYRIADGWISERLRGGMEERVVVERRTLFSQPIEYRVIRSEGIKIRQQPGLESEEAGLCPTGTIISVQEVQSILREGAHGFRLRIIHPSQHVGWVSDLPTLVEKLGESPGPDKQATALPSVADDPEIAAELNRRSLVRSDRKLHEKVKGNRSPVAESNDLKRFIIQGSLELDADNFFLFSGNSKSQGVSISSDFKTISCVGGHSGRFMVLGTRGFTRGLHYWEVQVDSLGAWGSLFIGVAPADSTQWNGYGLINYRATQAFGTETLFGSYYAANDTVGILLDMDHGTLSFFKDGENIGRTVVINMGVAYHNLRRNGANRSSSAMLFPCFGMKATGDKVSLRRCKWMSKRGLAPSTMLEHILNAKAVIFRWRSTYFGDCGIFTDLPRPLLEDLYNSYLRWRGHNKVLVRSRASLEVPLDTSAELIKTAAGAIGEVFTLREGTKFHSLYGDGVIVGARQGQVWFTFETNDTGAWYWTESELADHVSNGVVTFDDSYAVTPSRPPVTSEEESDKAIPVVSLAEFVACLVSKRWTNTEDEQIVRMVNTIADTFSLDPLRIPAVLLEKHRELGSLLPIRSQNEIQCRYAALCVLNKASSIVMPFSDFGIVDSRVPLVSTSITRQHIPSFCHNRVLHNGATFARAASSVDVLDLKNVLFTRTKKLLWERALSETTTPTGAPPDEFERPDDLKELKVNRPQSLNAEAKSTILNTPFGERLRVSIFGQLYDNMRMFDDRTLRRSFAHVEDAGQKRAFFVKFIGEGVDDHGGPYRAIFQAAVGEEPSNALGLLIPCPNAVANTGENRDKLVMNSSFLWQQDKLPFYTQLGVLLAMACRHNIMVPFSIPFLLWRPLLGEEVGLEDLEAIDKHFVSSLAQLSNGVMDPADIPELLSEAILNTWDLPTERNVADLRFEDASLSRRGTYGAFCARQLVYGNEFGELLKNEPSSMDYRVDNGSAAMENVVDVANLPEISSDRIKDVSNLIRQLRLTSNQNGVLSLYRGLSQVIPTELLAIFSVSEVESLFCGESDVDVELLKSVTIYESVEPTDRHILLFWDVLTKMTIEEKSMFINFCSGRSRLPASAKDFPMRFKITGPPPRSKSNPDKYLPIAQTCFFSLSLPEYSCFEVCNTKLQYAIRNTQLMDADFAMRNADGWEQVQ